VFKSKVKRRIVVSADDLLVVNGMELDGEILKAIVQPDKRVLWAFVRKGGDVRPVAYTEQQVIWLDRGEEDSDAS
jgi:hypothetical protein